MSSPKKPGIPRKNTPAGAPKEGNGKGGNRHLVTEGELELLREKLREAQETLEAIQSGAVDAVVINSEAGSQIYTLSGAEEPYRVYVESMQEGAVTVAPSGLILYCNRKFAEFLDIGLERVIGSDADDHFGREVWESIAGSLSNGTVKIESSLARPSGVALPVMITASPLEIADQTVVCLVVTDLSEQREKLALAAAKEIAEAANLTKDSFIAALSHELRTPLTPALMAASMLESLPLLDERSRSLATMIRRNVELETRLIDDLLDLTRISQGKIELHTKAVDVHAVIADAMAVCQQDLSERGQKLEFNLQATASRVMGDPVRLQQVFWNLIRNASKFSQDGKTVFISSRNDEAGRIEISIRDQGIGIAPEAKDRLFNAFEQGSERITREYGGLGLGLAISKAIAEMHAGGGIAVASPGPGEGSTFTLVLETLPSETVDANRDPGALGAILLVEDNPDTRLAITFLLEGLRYKVTAAGSVNEARELAERYSFDMLLSDVGLPDGSGHDLMSHLSKRYGIRGVAMSGYGMPEDIQRSKNAGFEEHLIKPLNPKDLEASLSRLRESL